MAGWSAENATNAYLRAMKMGRREKEPDASEFISALAAGKNARLMVVACADAADYCTTLALVAAAHQTGGEFVIGNAETLLGSDEYREADCVVVDCRIKNCERILKTAKGIGKHVLVLGYNAFLMGKWRGLGFDAHLLPIGEGLLVSTEDNKKERRRFGSGKTSRWVVKVDEFTGEEHVFRVRNYQEKAKF
ncbi:hypothetical protein DH2020_030993 [Rehmannia glutinosa]|uniref:Uncharacterized protein n=1 Tax=Rehmannia glutinosa TaxID=99300 RepID=A0ABR0VJ74_REHGL